MSKRQMIKFSKISSIPKSPYLFSVLMSRVLAILTILMALKLLGVSEFAQFDFYIMTAIVVAPVVSFCMPDGIYNYHKTGREFAKELYFRVLSFMVVSSLVFSVFILNFSTENVRWGYLFPLVFLTALMYMNKQILRSQSQYFVYAFCEPLLYIPPFFVMGYYFLNMSQLNLQVILVAYISGHLLSAFICTLFIFRKMPQNVELSSFSINFLTILKFSIWLVPSGFAFGFIVNGFRYFDVEKTMFEDLSLAFRIASYQIAINSIVFLAIQDKLYKRLGMPNLYIWKYCAIAMGKSLLGVPILISLAVPFYYFVNESFPLIDQLIDVFLLTFMIVIYGWSAIFSIIMHYHGLQKKMMFQVCLVVLVFIILNLFAPDFYIVNAYAVILALIILRAVAVKKYLGFSLQ